MQGVRAAATRKGWPLRHAGPNRPARPRALRLAARGAGRRAFLSRRILAGANMFNEMPSKGP
ncbi:MAG: hypothetical protein PPHEINF_2401 [uncultured Paraburkholderia sp.]|nr:MAG: hypothetical protein PPHEINF_2401 [uncultured Paraburkholderia sp.]